MGRCPVASFRFRHQSVPVCSSGICSDVIHWGNMAPLSLLEILYYSVAIFFFIYWCVYWTFHVLAIIHGKWILHRKVTLLPSEIPLPGVSILKPLVAVDPNLYSNLESYFTMNYPVFELLFCIHDESDPALMLVKKLQEKYPLVDTRVFIGGENVGINPKINNMQPGYMAAKYDLILVSDSGIRMKEDTMLDMVKHMTDEVGLVHQMPFTCDRKGFPAVLEKVFFGTFHARVYLCADLFGILCATGMSALMRKKILDEEGGLKKYGCYLAEDYFFSKTIRDKGWKIRIASQPAWQNSGFIDVAAFQERTTRWTKLRIAMVPLTAMFEPSSECLVLGAFSAWATNFLFGWDVVVLYLVHILVWFLLDYIMLCIVQNGSLPFSKFEYVVAWLIREFSSPYLFLKAAWDPTVHWRVGTYRLKWGGFVEEVKVKT